MRDLVQDLRYAARMLARTPGFTAAAVLTLALGIGANVAIFSLIDEIWLRPMPVPQADRLIRIFTSDRTSEGVVARGESSFPDFLDLRQATRTLSGVALLERRGALLDTGGENRLISAAVVSDNYFEVLGPAPARGRMFRETELRGAGARAVVLSYPFWKRQFQADPTLPGKTVLLDRREVLVTGILPRGFRGTVPGMVPDVWIPMTTWAELTGDRERQNWRGFRDYDLFARLRPEATLAKANAELTAISARLARSYPSTNAGRQMSAILESRSRGATVARMSLTLLAIAVLVLLIACANVASLLLARAEFRRHELATRVALGASRWQLLRQMMTETAWIALAATVVTLALGTNLIEGLPALLPEIGLTSQVDAHMSGRVFLFAGLAGLASLLLSGLLPALQAPTRAPIQALRGRTPSEGTTRARVRSGLVVAQIATSLILTVCGGLLVRSLINAENADPGFDAHQNMLVLEAVPAFGVEDPGTQRAFVEQARQRVEALPGVVATAAALRIPFGLSGSGATRNVFLPEARGLAQTEGIPIHYNPVSDRFFECVGTSVLRGRAIDAQDLRTQARVMIVNQTMARRFWPGRDPVGQTVRLQRRDGDVYRVVGVARDSVNADLAEGPLPYLYTPLSENDYGELTLVVKTRGDPSSLARDVRRTLAGVNRDVPIIYLATLRDHMRMATSEQRMTTGLIASLGALGLLLAAVGLYGLTSFLVGRRTREFGIRLALGAQARAVFGLVLGRAFVLTGIGVAAGAVAALAAARALRAFLFGVVPGDALSFGLGVAVVAAVTGAASFLPAWRATKVDPADALRSE